MNNKQYIITFFLLTTLCGGITVFCLVENKWYFAILSFIITVILFRHTINDIFDRFREIDDFAEAVKYRDFSKRYSETNRRKNRIYHGFNVITDTFFQLSREKEAQQHYLKKMLELVDTGILSYDMETMEILWMNESFMNMFKIPYLKNVSWMEKKNKELYDELIRISLGKNRLITVNTGKQAIKVLTNVSGFQTEGKTYKLVAFHNISATLEGVEVGAWKGLLKVMTHEIMNSIAPVSSLADTLKKRIENAGEKTVKLSHADFEDIKTAMETIHRRSEGLLKFADNYQNLSKTIVPELQLTNLYELLNNTYQLMYPSLQQKGIIFEIKTESESILANIDKSLIEQVLINFITNAMHAVKEKPEPQITLFSGKTTKDEPYITVADNGCGIPPEDRDKIFIPFFSTKKNGSGVGLSLSRDMVKLHGGKIQVQSQAGEESAFTVLFPALLNN